jgi:hypothetical protein
MSLPALAEHIDTFLNLAHKLGTGINGKVSFQLSYSSGLTSTATEPFLVITTSSSVE